MPSKPDPGSKFGYRSTVRITDRALQGQANEKAAAYGQAVEMLISRAEAVRPAPIREQMKKAVKEAARENAVWPAQATGKEARDDR